MNTCPLRGKSDASSVVTISAAKTEGTDKAGQQGTRITKFLLDNSADGNPSSVKTLVSLTSQQKDRKNKGKKREGPSMAERWANSPEWKGELTEATGEMGGGRLEPES